MCGPTSQFRWLNLRLISGMANQNVMIRFNFLRIMVTNSPYLPIVHFSQSTLSKSHTQAAHLYYFCWRKTVISSQFKATHKSSENHLFFQLSCFRAASIHCKSRAENQLENFDLNPLLYPYSVIYLSECKNSLKLVLGRFWVLMTMVLIDKITLLVPDTSKRPQE